MKTKNIDYSLDGTALESHLAVDETTVGKRPGVLILPAWMGVDDTARKRAEMLAQLGFVALVADVYGKDVRPSTVEEAGAQVGKYRADRPLLRARAAAGLAELAKQPEVDATRLAAIGYCFGGLGALELARHGADVRGVVSFHGLLDTPTPEDARRIKAKLLVLNGADDPLVPASMIAGFESEMRDAGVDWQFVSYGGAVHAFTDWKAGADKTKGTAYDASADQRSWTAMRAFFDEIFA